MMYEQKRKIMWTTIAAALALAVVVTAVLLFLNHTTYADFRTHQFQRLDLEMLGVEPGKEDGLYGTATWVGEGYSCTVERNGKTGECISIPYVNWEMYDVSADAFGSYAAVWFQVAERTLVDGKVCTGKSPYRYSNVTLTIIFDEQTIIGSSDAYGDVLQGNRTVEIGDVEYVEVAVLRNAMHLTPDEAEAELDKAWNKLEKSVVLDSWAQAIQMRLPENRSWKSPGYHISGKNPEKQIRFGMDCCPGYLDRLGTGQQKFPQTAYFKVTYDVENTVTGERTTHSTGWISQNYTAYGSRIPNN